MTSNLKDVSLYELALASQEPPQPLKISPSTFKSMLEAVMDVLVHHNISAKVWVKLPRGPAWQAVLARYCRATPPPSNLYILKRQSADSALSPSTRGKTGGTTSSASQLNSASSTRAGQSQTIDSLRTRLDHPSILPDDDDDDSEASELAATTVGTVLPLAPDSRLRREYFVLVVAPQFYVLMLAHRPRSARQSGGDLSGRSLASTTLQRSNTTKENNQERRYPLLGMCSFDRTTIETVLGGIQQALSVAQAQMGETPALTPLLTHWEEQMQLPKAAALDPILLSSLWAHHTQSIEDLLDTSTSARRQAEKASSLQLENEELLNAIRIKNEFLKSVGQELRTPLSAMKTALTLLDSPNLRPDQRQRYMDVLGQECDRQSALISSVLDLLQLETFDEQPTMQPLRLIDVVPGVVSTYQPLAQEKGLMLAYTIPEDLPTVSCLSSWLRQIVINLLHNGIKFTPKGGQVWVKGRAQGDYVQLEFRDTGIGITASDIPRIFDRFYRARQVSSAEETSGAGLGLSIVQQLLLRCGGSISVQSRQGEGSVFNVLLPVYHQER